MRRGLLIAGLVVTIVVWWAGPASAAARWVIQPSNVGAGGALTGVSCLSPTVCTAVGGGPGGLLADAWNGSTWAPQPLPAPPGGDKLLAGVWCATAVSCTAAGWSTPPSGRLSERPLAEHWDGSTWVIQATPVPTGAISALFTGVWCASATACTAVGSFTRSSGPLGGRPLAEHWDGTRWRLLAVPSPAGADSTFLSGISCSRPRNCTAAGYFFTRAPSGPWALAEHWDGSTWTIQATPSPAGSIDTQLLGISCLSPTSCTAAGTYQNNGAATFPLAEHWDGSTWAIQATPLPAGATGAEFAGISCVTPTSCTAAGDYGPSPGTSSSPLAEHWNGSTWTIQATPSPAGSFQPTLIAVSCVPPATCTAVGNYFNNNYHALIEAR